MDTILPYLANIAGLRVGEKPGVDYAALLNFFTEPCLIVERGSAKILFINTACLQFTAYKQEEVSGGPFSSLFPGASLELLSPGQDHFLKLNVRRSGSVPVIVRAFALGNGGKRLLIRLTPETTYLLQHTPKLWEKKVKGIQKLASLTEEPDLDSALGQSIYVTQQLLNSEFACIYQVDRTKTELNKLISRGAANSLPKKLPVSDLIKLSKTTMWMPGKKALTDIQRFAISAELSYLACVPLGEKDTLFGLLIVGASNGQPGNYLMHYLKVLGTTISGAIAHFVLLNNLQHGIEGQQRAMMMRDVLVDRIQEGVLILNPKLLIQEINPAAELMFEYSKGEVIGQPIDNVLIGAELFSSALTEAMHGNPTPDIGTVSLHKRSGQAFLANVQTIPIQQEGKLLNILVVVEDQSESEQIKLRTEQLEHRAFLGEFSSMFAHEVRNPINNISTGIELLSSRLPADDPNQDIINRTLGDCTRLKALMDSFLSYSRTLDVNAFELVDIANLTKLSIDRWSPRLARVNVSNSFFAEDDLPMVRGDARALERVFINLISNAVDAMSEKGGSLSVRVVRNDSLTKHPQVEVLVSDSGPGIPEEIIKRIFEPFVTTRPQGTGLGLAITKKILTDHRGSIRVSSVPGGTIFHVFLPAVIGEKK